MFVRALPLLILLIGYQTQADPLRWDHSDSEENEASINTAKVSSYKEVKVNYEYIEEQRRYYSRQREKNRFFSNSTLGAIPLIGPAIHETFLNGYDTYDTTFRLIPLRSQEVAIDANLGEMANRNAARLKEILKESNSAIRTKLIWDEFQDNSLFEQITSEMPDHAFKAFTSRGLIVLANRLETLAAEVSNNSLNIEVMKKHYRDFMVDIELKVEKIQKSALLQSEYDSNTIERQDITLRASRSIASIGEIETNDNEAKSPEDIKKEIELKKQNQELQQNLKLASQLINDSYEIALNLGMSGKDAQRAGKAVQYANVGISIAMAYAAPTPESVMGALKATSALFGKERISPEMQRHKAIMDAFSGVFENQQIIMKNQRTILENIGKLSEKLDLIQKENRLWFAQINDSFTSVLGNQQIMLDAIIQNGTREENRQACRQFFNSRFSCSFEDLMEPRPDFQHCIDGITKSESQFIPYPIKEKTKPATIRGFFKSYRGLASHFKQGNNPNIFSKCKKEIERIFGNPDQGLLYSKFYGKNYQTTYETEIKPVLLPLIELSKSYHGISSISDGQRDLAFNSYIISLTTPDSKEINKRNQRSVFFRNLPERKRFVYKGNAISMLENLYHVPALKQYSSYLLELGTYYKVVEEDFWGQGLSLKKPNTVVEELSQEVDENYYTMLRNAYYFTNIAIAQQALLSGDQSIHIIKEILTKEQRTHPLLEKVLIAVSKNDVLSHNVLASLLKDALSSSRTTPVLRGMQDNWKANLETYKNYLSNDYKNCEWDFNKNQYSDQCKTKLKGILGGLKLKGKNIVFNLSGRRVLITLPPLKSLQSSQLLYTSELFELVELRKEIMASLIKYPGLVKRLSEDIPFPII